MKNVFKMIGIIAFVTIIGMSLVGCPTPPIDIINYTITYSAGEGGGTVPASQNAAISTVITLPAQGGMTAPAGKEFDGWLTGSQKFAAGDNYTVMGNATFTAQWKAVAEEPVEYTVTYTVGDGGGTAPSSQTVENGTVITLPGQGSMTAPTGKEFQGWKAGDLRYNANTNYTVTADVTFVAQWGVIGSEPELFTVTYTVGEGSGTAPAAADVELNTVISLPGQGAMTAPTDKEFDGWMAGSQKYAASDSYTVTADVTFVAQWKAVAAGDPERFSITVTGLDAAPAGKFWGASLMTGTARTTVKAASMAQNLGNGSYKFNFFPFEGTGMPNITASFSTDGIYYVGLAITGMDQSVSPETTFILHKGTTNPVQVTFNQSNPSYEYVKGDFELAPPEGGGNNEPPPVDPFKFTVTGIDNEPAVGGWKASLLSGSYLAGASVKAVGILNGTSFEFFTPKSDGSADTTKPYAEDGTFYVRLADNSQTLALYSGDTVTKLTYDEDNAAQTKAFTDFKAPVFKLKVTNLATPDDEWFATINYGSVAAAGVLGPDDTFTFYTPKSDGTPDTTKPFYKNVGTNCTINLSDGALDNNAAKLYSLYKSDGSAAEIVSFTNTDPFTYTADMGKFKLLGVQFKLIVPEANGSTNWVAWLIPTADLDANVIALRTYIKNGTFDFLASSTPTGITAVVQNNSAPFSTADEYYIGLFNGVPSGVNATTALIYCGSGSTPVKVTFNAGTPSHTFALADFKAAFPAPAP